MATILNMADQPTLIFKIIMMTLVSCFALYVIARVVIVLAFRRGEREYAREMLQKSVHARTERECAREILQECA